MSKEGWANTLMSLNPATPLILTARDWLTGQTPEYLGYFLAVNGLALVFFLVVWVIYRLAMPILIERMGG
jgi:lipopolysaccharide transport system permease protein